MCSSSVVRGSHVVIPDSRLLTKRYGKRIIDALPPFKRVIG